MVSLNTTEMDQTLSPCIGTCSTVSGDDICKGCLRTFDEVITWHTLSDKQKISINQRLVLDRTRMSKRAFLNNRSDET